MAKFRGIWLLELIVLPHYEDNKVFPSMPLYYWQPVLCIIRHHFESRTNNTPLIYIKDIISTLIFLPIFNTIASSPRSSLTLVTLQVHGPCSLAYILIEIYTRPSAASLISFKSNLTGSPSPKVDQAPGCFHHFAPWSLSACLVSHVTRQHDSHVWNNQSTILFL